MKNSILKSVLILILFTSFLSCSSDSNSPACLPITCLNGGTSTSNCGCNCPTGFKGTNCSTQITPTKISITKIRIKAFPNTDSSNSNWDVNFPDASNALPDIFVTLENVSEAFLYQSPNYYANVISNGSNFFDFTPTTPIEITNVNSSFLIKLYDYDQADSNISSDPDLMAYKAFNFYSSSSGFPATLIVSNENAPFQVEFSLTYQW